MDREKLIARVANALRYNADHSVVSEVVDYLVNDLQLSIVSLRQAGWVDPDDHVLYELDTDEEYSSDDWRPVYEVGSTALGLPPMDLDDDEAWG